MTFEIYDFLRENGSNDFKTWWGKLQKKERTKLRQKLDMLSLYGDDLHPQVLSDTGVPGIQKIRVQGNPKLRPLLCKGPRSIATEYTMLLGAKEVGDVWVPGKAPERANSNKDQVILDPTRRTEHEKIS